MRTSIIETLVQGTPHEMFVAQRTAQYPAAVSTPSLKPSVVTESIAANLMMELVLLRTMLGRHHQRSSGLTDPLRCRDNPERFLPIWISVIEADPILSKIIDPN